MAAAAKKKPPAKTGKKTAAAAKRRTGAAKTASAPATPDAIALLIADHREVEKLYKSFESLKEKDDDQGKQHVAEEICLALRVHTQIEEEIFYPAIKKAVEQDEIDEAVVEHAAAKNLIEQIEGMGPEEDLYDAKVKVLWEEVQHHVEEEETEMFPEVKKDKSIDLKALGEQLARRKEELTRELAG